MSISLPSLFTPEHLTFDTTCGRLSAPIGRLTVIIICRFLLALQRANVKSTGLETTDSELGGSGGDQYGSGTLHFASAVIGSVGGAIDAGVDVDDDDSELTFGYVDEYEDLGSTLSPEFAKPEGDSGISMV